MQGGPCLKRLSSNNTLALVGCLFTNVILGIVFLAVTLHLTFDTEINTFSFNAMLAVAGQAPREFLHLVV